MPAIAFSLRFMETFVNINNAAAQHSHRGIVVKFITLLHYYNVIMTD